ncbi:MAG: phenylacetic acid degradation protein PaaN [Planctomycetota bacterium]|nr:MAG: phenylacetic acid degradation protein PaaN [Planctomycetota bacterium]
MSESWFQQHQETLQGALQAIATRAYWSAFPEIPSGKIYGESAKDDGLKAFQRRLDARFELDQPGGDETVGEERSPFGVELHVRYPRADLDKLTAAAVDACRAWRDASVEMRTGVCFEILKRLNAASFELAFAVMHTTGQGFMMAFQAGGPHAQDRALEAVAYAYREQTSTPAEVLWTKQVSKTDKVTLRKRFRVVPRGLAAVVGCSTFPTWNSYPAIFASLATGNGVIVKPHPGAVLPLAITIEVARKTLAQAGFDPNIITLAADSHDAPIAKELVTREEIGIVDYTGGSAFGAWIEDHARQAVVFTEKAGVNPVVLDSVEDLKSFTGNLAFSLSLYSGQMCTTPQNIFIPKDGIAVGGERKSFDEIAAAIVGAVDWLLGDAKRGAEILGAIQNPATLERVAQAAGEGGEVLRASTPVANEMFPDARVASPLILKVAAADERLYMREMFGPIAYLVATEDTEQSIRLATKGARGCGAITAAVYSTDKDVCARAERALTDAGAAVSCNLTGPIYVNQAAAFSDFHVSGVNPAGNATLTDTAYVAGRFRIVQSRAPIAAD